MAKESLQSVENLEAVDDLSEKKWQRNLVLYFCSTFSFLKSEV